MTPPTHELPRVARRLTAPLLLALAVLTGMAVAQTAAAPAASAHDVLVKTIPSDGARVGKVPARVVVVFDEPAVALGTQIVVKGPDGAVQTGKPTLVDNEVRQAIGADAPSGHYTVSWRVTSADGHPVSGQFAFTAAKARGAGAGPASAPPTTASATPGSAGASGASSGARPTTTMAPAGPTQQAGQSGQDNPGSGPSAKVWVIIAIVIVLLVAAAEFVRRRRRREP